MQVQLIVANEHHKGQSIPINVPSFTIGRAEGCNLRSRSTHVSRQHCAVHVNDGTVTIQDLGGENGTFVNDKKIVASQELHDGDRLVVGAHSFIVSIKTEGAKQEVNNGDFFELTPASTGPASPKQSDETNFSDPNMETIAMQAAKPPKQAAEIMFDIRLDGQRVSVTKNRLFDLARKGAVLPDDLITVAGTKVFADSIQGIVFGEKSPTPVRQTSTATPSQSLPPTPPPSAPPSDPFALPDLDNIAAASHPFHDVVSEPFVRIARKESAFGAIWKALDISFSRVYTIEGNNLVIHSIKALYYVLVVGAFILFFKTVIDFGIACSKEESDFLAELGKHYMGVAVTLFGGVTIIVIVRVLLEMLLLAWIESAQTEQKEKEE